MGETSTAYSSPSSPFAHCLDSIPRIQRVYQRLTVVYYSVPYGHLLRAFQGSKLETRHQTVLIMLLLSLSQPGGGDNRPVRRLSQGQQSHQRAGWLAASTQQAISKQVQVPSTILHIGRTVPMHTILPTNQSCFVSTAFLSAGSEWPREWQQVAVFVLLLCKLSNTQAYSRLGQHGPPQLDTTSPCRKKTKTRV